MRRLGTLALGLALGLGLALTLGCKQKDESSTTPAPASPPPGGPPNPSGPMMGSSSGTSPQSVLAKLPGGEVFAAGKKVYADNNCAMCHKLGETGGQMGGPPGKGPPGMGPPGMGPPGMGGPQRPGGGPQGPGSKMGGPPRPGMGLPSGPDLTAVGAAPEHTKEWLADQIRDPKKHNANTQMPTFDKINDAELTALATYLASRKDGAPTEGAPKEGPPKEGAPKASGGP